MEPSQGEIIQKPKMKELSSLFMTHHIIVMHALVKFHEYIPYSLGVIKSRGNNSKTKNVRVVFLVHDTLSYYDVCTCEVS